MTAHPTMNDVIGLLRTLGGSQTRREVTIRFDGLHWVIAHESIEAPLRFDTLDDAEMRAVELGRAEGYDDVVVYDQQGAIIDSIVIEEPIRLDS